MPRPSQTGVRGLYRDDDGRYFIDLRLKDRKTGARMRYREALPEGTKAPAAKFRAENVLSDALRGELRQEQGRRLKAAMGEYIKWRRSNGRADVDRQEDAADRLVASLGDIDLASISPFAVEKFKRDRQTDGAGPATVNRDLAVLRHFFTMAARWGWVTREQSVALHEEVPLLKEPPGRRSLSVGRRGKPAHGRTGGKGGGFAGWW